jgi:hypothetical protein
MLPSFLTSLLLSSTALAQQSNQNTSNPTLRTDPGVYGPALEEYHYYYTQWPIGLAISSTGRFFVSYTRGSYAFTLGEVVNKTAETPYPSASLNLPPAALNTSWNGIPFGSCNSTGLISAVHHAGDRAAPGDAVDRGHRAPDGACGRRHAVDAVCAAGGAEDRRRESRE